MKLFAIIARGAIVVMVGLAVGSLVAGALAVLTRYNEATIRMDAPSIQWEYQLREVKRT